MSCVSVEDVVAEVNYNCYCFAQELRSSLRNFRTNTFVDIQVENETRAAVTARSQLDAPFDDLWWSWETKALVATHKVHSIAEGSGDCCTVKEIARRIYEENEISINVNGFDYGFWHNERDIVVTLSDGFKMTVRRPAAKAKTKVWQDGLRFVAHFARNAESLKIAYQDLQPNWILPVFADRGHWKHTLINLEVICGESSVYINEPFQSRDGLSSYPQNLKHFGSWSNCHRTSFEADSLSSFLMHLPCLETIAVPGTYLHRIVNRLSRTAPHLKVLELKPDSDYHTFGHLFLSDSAMANIYKFENLQELSMETCEVTCEKDFLHILEALPQTTIVRFFVGPTKLTDAGADLLCSYLSSPLCRLEEMTFGSQLPSSIKSKLIAAVTTDAFMSRQRDAQPQQTEWNKYQAESLLTPEFAPLFNRLLSWKASTNRCREFIQNTALPPALVPKILVSASRQSRTYPENDRMVMTMTIFSFLRERPDLVHHFNT